MAKDGSVDGSANGSVDGKTNGNISVNANGPSNQEYEEALKALGTLITSLKRSDGSKWQEHFDTMHIFLQRLGLTEALANLKVVHVAGTKGKGSTCCMVESMLRKSGYKTGLFTSPHLCDVRERIRLNGKPVEKDLFIKYFWESFQTFKKTSSENAGMPAYFRFLTLLAFKTFIEEKVDVAIMEVGLGGRLDATNIVSNPIVCGISSLGYDHMELLGYTLTEIAREKAGIFKKGRPAITIPQDPEAQASLEVEARKAGVVLRQADDFSGFRDTSGHAPAVGLAGSHQKINAALAIALASEFESQSDSSSGIDRSSQIRKGILPDTYADGLRTASWPGRCQVISEKFRVGNQISHLDFFLDGAHTPESLTACGHWFADISPTQTDSRIPQGTAGRNGHSNGSLTADISPIAQDHSHNLLVFNCMKEREPERLLNCLQDTLLSRKTSIHSAIFVPPDSVYHKPSTDGAVESNVDLSWQLHLRSVWEKGLLSRPGLAEQKLQSAKMWSPVAGESSENAVMPSIKSTLKWLRNRATISHPVKIRVLVTGSLYLVGDFLRHLDHENSL